MLLSGLQVFSQICLIFLKMAKKGRITLFGNGENKINPIHGADLAIVCVSALKIHDKEINVGGPDIFTFHEILL